MNTFSLVQRALDASLADESKAGLDASTIETGRIVAAVQTVVDALTPPDGGRYIVGFADIATAQTSLGERRIIVSRRPMTDRSLSMVEKAVVIATFAAHEIGHTLVTAPRKGRIVEHNQHSGFHAVANLADDIILEPTMVDRYPILADAFAFTGLWVLRATAKDLPKVYRLTADLKTAERFNVLLSATRYADIPEIVFEGSAALAERDWCRVWADRLIATRLDDHTTFLALCDEAWERIRTEPEQGDEQPTDEPEPDEGDDDSEDEDDDSEDEDDDSEDEDDDSEDEGDEPEGEQGEGEDEGGSDDDEGDEPGESEDDERVADANDQPTDWDDDSEDDESEDEDESGEGEGEGDESEDESDEDGESEGEGDDGDVKPEAPKLRDENDFRASEVDQSMHQQAESDPYDWGARDAEQAVRTYATTTVTAFGKHGSMSTEWS